jgi:UDP-N-acetylmuramate dehydrogenase
LSLIPNINSKYGAIEQELTNRNISDPTIKDVSRVVSHIRVSKLPDPSTIGNAGSFFKNPVIGTGQFEKLQPKFPEIVHYPAGDRLVKLAAGWLIEQCGWKGKVVGHTGTWKNQALVLVNHGGATGEEVYSLSSQIIDSVYTKFGVLLEREVNIIS